MRKLFTIGVLTTICLLPAISSATEIGVASYWGETGAYDKVPAGGIALVNPNNGVLDVSGEKLDIAANSGIFAGIIDDMKVNDVGVYAYVPTGYFKHDCNINAKCQTWERIVTQVFAYFELYPELDGIFFDEASGSGDEVSCDDYALEYGRLRGLVKRYKEDANIVFNPGWSNPCAVKAAKAGEIVLTFEGKRESYKEWPDTTRGAIELAKERGVKTWHLVYSVKGSDELQDVVAEAKAFGVDYFFATNIGGNWQAGENTWGSPGGHWSEQIKLLQD